MSTRDPLGISDGNGGPTILRKELRDEMQDAGHLVGCWRLVKPGATITCVRCKIEYTTDKAGVSTDSITPCEVPNG